MGKKKEGVPDVVEQLRQAVRDSGQSIYQISAAAGVDRGGLSRFMRGERDLTISVVAKLCQALRLELVPSRQLPDK